MGILSEFAKFVRENNVLGAAIAFVAGLATKDLVDSLVNNLIMPLIGLLLPSGDWREAIIEIGTAKIGAGQLLGAIINFLIILLVIFFVVKAANRAGIKTK